MTRDEVKTLLRRHLKDNVRRPGQVLYSGLDTLKRGQFYVMGYNPALDGVTNEKSQLIATLDYPGIDGPWSAYVHQCWKCDGKRCVHLGPDGIPKTERHQRNVKNLFHDHGGPIPLAPYEVFAANAIFVASKRASDIAKEEATLWNQCWPIHQAFLREIRPKCIICLGMGEKESSFSLLRTKANRWTLKLGGKFGKHVAAQFDLGDGCGNDTHEVDILAVFHPSYDRKGRVEFISERLGITSDRLLQ